MTEKIAKISIKELVLPCIIGVTQREQEEKQQLILTLTLFVDITKATSTDNILHTADYKALYTTIIQFVDQSSFHLLESLADGIATICLQDHFVQKVQVCIEKPKALKLAKAASIELIRERAVVIEH